MTHRAFAVLTSTLCLAHAACGSNSSGQRLTQEDGGIDSDTASEPLTPEDFSAFKYSWYGTGRSGSFVMDGDCGVSSTGPLYNGDKAAIGSGVVPASECNELKTVVISPSVVGSLPATPAKCTPGTDDHPRIRVELSKGRTIEGGGSGCSGVEPFASLVQKARELREKYVMPLDSGTADGGDAADSGT